MFVSKEIVEQMAAFFGPGSLPHSALAKAAAFGCDCLFFFAGSDCFVMRRKAAWGA